MRFHSHLSGFLRLRNYPAVAGNHKFSSRFSVFACFCGGYSNRVKRLRRLSGNFILLKASLFNKGLPFRARPSQSGVLSIMPKIPKISVGIQMEKFVSVSSDRNIQDHLWRWSIYFGRNIPTEIRRSIVDKPFLCPN